MGHKFAVVGATGKVGREMLVCLAESGIASEVVALASEKSKGKKISFGDIVLEVQSLVEFDFTGTDIALFSAGSEISKKYAHKAANQGCIVIDNASYFRMDPEVPLIVPEINPHKIGMYVNKNIIANPNCCAIPLALVLKPLNDHIPIKRVVVSTYQSVSGAGKEAMDELYHQTKGKYMNDHVTSKKFSRQIAFNLIPHIDVHYKNGETKEEWKLRKETQKILDKEIPISTTCVRVPVFIGHSESVNIEFEQDFSPEFAREILYDAPGIVVVDNEEDIVYMTPVDVVGENAVFVSRIRKDPSLSNGLNIWLVSDNLRKGAALNAIQIAEEVIKNYL